MIMEEKIPVVETPPQAGALPTGSPFMYPRDYLGNRFVYLVISPRVRGLAVGVNMNPDKFCNFDCVYCEVNRKEPPVENALDMAVMAAELEKTLDLACSDTIRQLPRYARLNKDLLRFHHVMLSGDGEPTLSPVFSNVVQETVHLRALGTRPYFNLVLLTNGTGLDLPPVQEGLQYFTREDEIWIRLDAGTQEYMDKVNRGNVPLGKVLQNTLALGQRRPIIIQSMFPVIDGQEPPAEEIAQYIHRLNELKTGGASISLVQIYSAVRPTANPGFGHLPLKSLSRISRQIRAETGLKAEVF